MFIKDVKWYFPKLKNGHSCWLKIRRWSPDPKCAYFVKDANKVKDIQVAEISIGGYYGKI